MSYAEMIREYEKIRKEVILTVTNSTYRYITYPTEVLNTYYDQTPCYDRKSGCIYLSNSKHSFNNHVVRCAIKAEELKLVLDIIDLFPTYNEHKGRIVYYWDRFIEETTGTCREMLLDIKSDINNRSKWRQKMIPKLDYWKEKIV
jgi:hypothetical protein